ncbi:MAG: response regulator [Mariprofundales bacterium]
MIAKAVNILLVEDNMAHAELVMRSFEDHAIANHIYHVKDGEEALDYLFNRGKYSDCKTYPLPHLMLLDLRLPKIDGLEVLKQLRKSDVTKKLPVVILTTSAAETDAAQAYEYNANSYLVKPLDFAQFNRLMQDIGNYWLAWNHYPWS